MSEPPPSLPPLRDIIKEFGLGARKSLGQHFLLDTNLTDKIARAAGSLDEKTVIEVGPGPGGLTRSLLARSPKRLVAIEKDARCVDALQSLRTAYTGRFTIVSEDATTYPLSRVTPDKAVIVSNLPYNVGTQILLGWLGQLDHVERMILMFQKEVADRITAPPSTSSYGRLSVFTQWLCETRHLFNVDKKAFTPPPRVMSSVVELVPRAEPAFAAEREKLEKVTQAAFGQRRKMLRKSLQPLGISPQDVGIDPERRAETLTIEEFCALARLL